MIYSMSSNFNCRVMKKRIVIVIVCLYATCSYLSACSKKTTSPPVLIVADTGLVNTAHLDHLFTDIVFPDNMHAAGIYIYSQYPDYHPVEANGEGFTCVDDVSRATLVYMRSSKFSSDTATRSKVYKLIQFILEMQSGNGYFYNFLFTGNSINTAGPTSVNTPNWWSWRALLALTEAAPLIKNTNAPLYNKVTTAVSLLVARIKLDLAVLPQTTTVVEGITIPEWLPVGSGTDQSALLILGLINYCSTNNDTVISSYITKLADGIALMQQGDATHFPYNAFLSWQNTWHAYGNLQAYALMVAAGFLNSPQYNVLAMAEVDNFYPWLLKNGYKASFTISDSAGDYQILTQSNYDQIAYGIEPMVFAAAEAYKETGQAKYADMAGQLAAWFLGANESGNNMYILSTGVCYDGLSSGSNVNLNSGAESTIEALLTLEKMESDPVLKAALMKYKK
jgi:hypothetical protein